jgi:hypothetical protein
VLNFRQVSGRNVLCEGELTHLKRMSFDGTVGKSDRFEIAPAIRDYMYSYLLKDVYTKCSQCMKYFIKNYWFLELSKGFVSEPYCRALCVKDAASCMSDASVPIYKLSRSSEAEDYAKAYVRPVQDAAILQRRADLRHKALNTRLF